MGDSTTDPDAENAVRCRVRPALVKGQQHQGVLGEVLVLQQRRQEPVHPVAGDGDVGVVRVVGHAGRDEHVLRHLVVVQIIIELVKFLIWRWRVLSLVTEPECQPSHGVPQCSPARCPRSG